MTVNELKYLCEDIINKGYGDHNVVIADDEEGNGYHDLFYPFITDQEIVKSAVCWSCNPRAVSDVDHSVILG